jgi:5,10-methylenetetrahydrofolate reductase
MLRTALVSAEVSLPGRPDAARVRERIAVLADAVDVVGLTDNHAGQARMSPLAAVALAREQGVATIVHVSCRDRNRLPRSSAPRRSARRESSASTAIRWGRCRG